MNISETTLMSELEGETLYAPDFSGGDHDYRFHVSVGDADTATSVVFREPLQFHKAYHGEDWAQFAGEGGWLSDSALETILERVVDALEGKISRDDLETPDSGSDEPEMYLDILAPYLSGETFAAWFDRIGWPIIATLIDISDPGTFNSPYLFSNLPEKV